MIRHIVMMRLKETADPEEKTMSIMKLKAILDDLPTVIKEILEWDTGINVNSYPQAFDLVLVSSFKDEASLDVYRTHPNHEKVLGFIKEVVKDLAVVDYPYVVERL